MLKLKLVQLDQNGSVVNFYSNATIASKCNNVKQPAISRNCNNISKMIRNEKTKTNAMFVNGYCFVKLEDWISNKEEILWLLRKNDILCIDNNGNIVSEYKTVIDTLKALTNDESNNKKMSIYRVLNDKHQVFENYRLTTRENYKNMIQNNSNYYKEEYGRRNKIILYKKINNEIDVIKEFNTLEETAKYLNCAVNTVRYALTKNTKILKSDLYLKYGRKIPFYNKKK